ncbi:MAG TPA: cytochrome c oxidase subunit II transmembrane domain-containing protein, partial [Allosphingosinicella sp.]|nr:cytochrome c oxidase subunit II transmembrane domain-containing protein [Allosphingosinicella sp.]
MGWAIALAAAGLTPATAMAQATEAAAPQVTAAPQPAAPAPVVAPADAAPPAAAPAAPGIDHVAPTPGVGVPDGRMGLQDQVTEVGQQAAGFHNNWLLVLCVVISLFVLALLVWTIVRYRRGANPTPSRTSHNTLIEVVWTLVPVLILVAIAIPSIRLIRAQYSPPPADLTVKVIGNQWYWTYQYPDNGGFEIVSNMLKEQKDVKAGDRFRTDADGPPLLAVDERLVIPAGKVVKFIVTSNDVIHAFALPAFWTKIDANPGRLNETWVKVDRPGV